MKLAMSTMALTALAVAIGVSGCSTSSGPKVVDKTEVAQQISDQLKAQVGKAPDIVKCPQNLEAKNAATLVCTLTNRAVVYDVTVTVTSVANDDVKFDIKVADQPNP
jgi:hypothetical protein